MAEGFFRRGQGVRVLELGGGSVKGEIERRGDGVGDKVEGRDGRDGAGAFDEGRNKDGACRDRSHLAGGEGGDVGKGIEGGQGMREVDALRFGGEKA